MPKTSRASQSGLFETTEQTGILNQEQDQVIGFIGYGAMASRMGNNLLRAGYKIIAYTPSGKIADHGLPVPICASPKDVAKEADIVVICVPNDAAETSSLYGESGLLSGVRIGQLVLDCSTISPAQADHLAYLGKMHRFAVMDCPVSGSTPQADDASLIILASGAEDSLERARPVLEKIGRTIIYAGHHGMAARLKLVINGIMGATLNVIAEGLAYGLASGVDRDVLFSALQEVAVIGASHKHKLTMAESQSFPSEFSAMLMSKDMGLLLDAGRATGTPMPAMAVASQAFARSALRHPHEDYAVLLGDMETDSLSHPVD